MTAAKTKDSQVDCTTIGRDRHPRKDRARTGRKSLAKGQLRKQKTDKTTGNRATTTVKRKKTGRGPVGKVFRGGKVPTNVHSCARSPTQRPRDTNIPRDTALSLQALPNEDCHETMMVKDAPRWRKENLPGVKASPHNAGGNLSCSQPRAPHHKSNWAEHRQQHDDATRWQGQGSPQRGCPTSTATKQWRH